MGCGGSKVVADSPRRAPEGASPRQKELDTPSASKPDAKVESGQPDTGTSDEKNKNDSRHSLRSEEEDESETLSDGSDDAFLDLLSDLLSKPHERKNVKTYGEICKKLPDSEITSLSAKIAFTDNDDFKTDDFSDIEDGDGSNVIVGKVILKKALEELKTQDVTEEKRQRVLTTLKDLIEEDDDDDYQEPLAKYLADRQGGRLYAKLIQDILNSSVEEEMWEKLTLLLFSCRIFALQNKSFSKQLIAAGGLTASLREISHETFKDNYNNSEVKCNLIACALQTFTACQSYVPKDSDDMKKAEMLADFYDDSSNDEVKQSASLVKMMITLKSAVGNVLDTSDSDSSSDDDTAGGEKLTANDGETTSKPLKDLAEALAALFKPLMDVQSKQKAKHFATIGMPYVYTNKIKAWLKDEGRYGAFNNDEDKWKDVKEWFENVEQFSLHSSEFCIGLLDAGILRQLQDVLSNQDIKDAHTGNAKVNLLITLTLKILHNLAKIRNKDKWFSDINFVEPVVWYTTSNDMAIKIIAMVCLACIAEGHSVDMKLQIRPDDLALLHKIADEHKEDQDKLAFFMANTTFPALATETCKSRLLIKDVFDEQHWEIVLAVFAMLIICSDKNAKFASELMESGFLDVISSVLCSRKFKKAFHDESDENHENVETLMKICLKILRQCARVENKIKFLQQKPEFYDHIFQFLDCEEINCKQSAFVFFALMNSSIKEFFSKKPKISATIDFYKFVYSIYCFINTEEESVVGDFLAEIGMAKLYVESLTSIFPPGDTISMDLDATQSEMFTAITKSVYQFGVESEAFAVKLCDEGIVNVLKRIISAPVERYNDTKNNEEDFNVTHQETSSVQIAMDILWACSSRSANVKHYWANSVTSDVLIYAKSLSLKTEIRRHAWMILANIYHYDKENSKGFLEDLKIPEVNMENQNFLSDLYSKCDYTVKGKVGNLLAAIDIPKLMLDEFRVLIREPGALRSDSDEWSEIRLIASNLWNFTDDSEDFSNSLCRNGGPATFIHDILMEDVVIDQFNISTNVGKLLEAVVGAIANCARFPINHPYLTEVDTVARLEAVSTSQDIDIQIGVILTTAHLIDDHDTYATRLTAQTGRSVKFIIQQLSEALHSDSRRAGDDVTYSALELAQGLYRLSLNDSNKVILVYEGVIPLIQIMMTTGNINEQREGARLAHQLAFNAENCREMRENYKFMTALTKLTTGTNTDVEGAATNALFQINKDYGRIREKLETKKKLRDESNMQARQNAKENESAGLPAIQPSMKFKYDIMISYSWDKQPVVLKLRKRLADAKYNVWIDLENMQHRILDSMSDAIETSQIILVMVSQRYKESANCRSEAEYARDLNKSLIPIKTEVYKPSGWLGMIIAGKYYIDFTEVVHNEGDDIFEKKFQMLEEEIHNQRGLAITN